MTTIEKEKDVKSKWLEQLITNRMCYARILMSAALADPKHLPESWRNTQKPKPAPKRFLTLVFAFCVLPVFSQSEIPATLGWTVSTNWSNAGQTRTLMGWTGDVDPNVTTYSEVGTVSSNLVATVEWKGKITGVVVESVFIRNVYRSYTMSAPARVYK